MLSAAISKCVAAGFTFLVCPVRNIPDGARSARRLIRRIKRIDEAGVVHNNNKKLYEAFAIIPRHRQVDNGECSGILVQRHLERHAADWYKCELNGARTKQRTFWIFPQIWPPPG